MFIRNVFLHQAASAPADILSAIKQHGVNTFIAGAFPKP
jgi:hypothetical protein